MWTKVGCKWAGMHVGEHLAAQRLWYHLLDDIATPSDQNLILQENGWPQGPELSVFQMHGMKIIQGRAVALRKHGLL